MIFIYSLRKNDVNPNPGKQVEFGRKIIEEFNWEANESHEITVHCGNDTIITTLKVRGSQRGGDRAGVDCKEYANAQNEFPIKDYFIHSKGLNESHVGKVSFILEPIDQYGDEFNLYFANLKTSDNGNPIVPYSQMNNSWIQEIRYGAPGTGKSQGLKGKSNTTRITFHPDTDYASFVGCYKPTMEDGEIKYSFSPQAFFDAYVAAWNNPTKEHNLLIEEINRGNCAQIFGDLFQLLDRDDNGFSDYPIKADTDMWNELSKVLPANYVEFLTDYYKESQGEGFSGEGKIALPPNLSIIATMNTSDNSLYKMDSAFKRRWAWEYIAIDYNEEKLTDVVLDFADAPNNKWLPILERINKFIKENTGSTSKQIGQWFVKPQKNEANKYTTITLNTFVNKVMFFLFNDVFKDRDELKSLFGKDDEEFLFEDLVTLPGSQKTELLKTFIKNLPEIEAR